MHIYAAFRFKDIHKLKVRGWKKISYANGSEKKAKVAYLHKTK